MRKLTVLRWLLAIAASVGVSACICDSDVCRVGGGGIAIGGAGGGSSSSSSTPMVPPVSSDILNMSQEPLDEDDVSQYEVHGAVNPQDCKRMLQRFLNEGRRVRLRRIAPNPFNRGGGVLRFACIFDGEDASPEATPFEDSRFPQDDSAFP